MKALALIGLAISLTACAANFDGAIDLNGNEKTQAQKLAEHRQDINFRIQEAQADFQSKMNRLNEELQQVNIQSQEMAFQLKKAHQLDPDAHYSLDEWKGQLVKVK